MQFPVWESMAASAAPVQVTMGGATVFVVDVEQFYKY